MCMGHGRRLENYCLAMTKIPIENTLQIRRTGVYCKQPLMEMTVSERDNSIISLQGRVQVPTGGKAREPRGMIR